MTSVDGAVENAATRVTVAVLTFHRPADLAALLPMLLEQAGQVSADPPGKYLVDVLVVDNDPTGSAAAVVEGVGSAIVRYVVEPEPGISAARNRALDEAGASRLLAFIDDDERPHPTWLRHLLEARAAHQAHAVAGRVVSEFDGEPDPWIAAGGFLERAHRAGVPTGAAIASAATNNLLLDLREVARTGLGFDAAFGLSGGEDSLFTQTFVARGGRLVWCGEAVVTDRVPVSRINRGWVLRRALSHGNTHSRVAVRMTAVRCDRLRVRGESIFGGIERIMGGLLRYLLGVLSGSVKHQARGLRTAARGAGMVSGAVGYAHKEYARD